MEPETLGVMLKSARKGTGLSAREVCEQVADLDQPGISRLENSRCMPMMEQLKELCAVYGADMERAIRLVALEYGLRTPEKAVKQKEVSDIYKFTAAMSRDVARALLEIVQAEGYASTQEWFAATVKRKLRRKKIAAGAGAPTTSAEKMKSSLL